MKNSIIALALAASAFTGIAHAATNDALATQAQPAATSHTQGKTRADVRRELVQAQKDGQIAAINSFYRGS